MEATDTEEKRDFRVKFRHSLRRSVERGFSVEECFGVVWEETLEKVNLSDSDQRILFAEMIEWARRRMS